MARIPHWNSFLGPLRTGWDFLVLGGVRFPGVASVDVNLRSSIDEQKPRGARCARLQDAGDYPARLKIRIQLASDEDVALMVDIIRVLRPMSKDSARNPFEIIHPNPNAWGITTVVLGDIESPQPSAIEGWVLELEAFEWVPDPKDVQPQKTKPQSNGDADDAQAWAPYVDRDVGNLDDGVAGSGAGMPSRNNAASDNLGL